MFRVRFLLYKYSFRFLSEFFVNIKESKYSREGDNRDDIRRLDMKGFIKEKVIEFFICIAVIVVISYVPFRLIGNEIISFFTYLQQLFSLGSGVYFDYISQSEVSLWDRMLDPYWYSMSILFLSTCVTIFLATCLSFSYILSSVRVKKIIEHCLIFIESIPDLLLIFSLQLFFVWLYKQTGLKLVKIYSFGDTQAYFLPIVVMSIVPALHLFRIMVLFLLEEQNKPYVEFAYAKGLKRGYIMFVHLFRNVLYHLLNHLQSIFLFMISSLLLVEAAFNVNGYMSFLLKPFVLTPVTTACWILLLFIPSYLVFTIAHYQVHRTTGGLVDDK